MINPLQRTKQRTISTKDYSRIKHNFLMLYGYEMWKEIGLDELFEMLPEMEKEIARRENLRLSTLKYYGVNNPK